MYPQGVQVVNFNVPFSSPRLLRPLFLKLDRSVPPFSMVYMELPAVIGEAEVFIGKTLSRVLTRMLLRSTCIADSLLPFPPVTDSQGSRWRSSYSSHSVAGYTVGLYSPVISPPLSTVHYQDEDIFGAAILILSRLPRSFASRWDATRRKKRTEKVGHSSL